MWLEGAREAASQLLSVLAFHSKQEPSAIATVWQLMARHTHEVRSHIAGHDACSSEEGGDQADCDLRQAAQSHRPVMSERARKHGHREQSELEPVRRKIACSRSTSPQTR